MSVDSEEWRPSLAPLYEVSSHGRVRKRSTGLVLKRFESGSGRPRVNIGFGEFVDIIVMDAFHDAPLSPKSKIVYIDGNRANCHASNLRWT